MDLPLNYKEITRLLPHRYPFLLVDRVVEVEKGRKIVCIKNVTFNEPFFQGHFPDKPIFPGVLILEGLAQAGGCMAFCSVPEMIGERLVYFAGIDKARFRKPVIPGDQIEYRMELLKHKRMIMVMKGQAFVDDQLVTEAELMASFV